MLLRRVINLLREVEKPYYAIVFWHFKQFIWALDKKIKGVYLYENLRYGSNSGQKLLGMITSENKIYLESKQKPVEMLQTFIHELCHFLYEPVENDREIDRISLYLWRTFSDYQRKKLMSYIPKKISGSGAPKKNK